MVTPSEETWDPPRVLRQVERQIFSSQIEEEDHVRAPESPIKTPVAASAGKASFSKSRKSRPYDWTKTYSLSEVLLLADMIEMKHLKNTDRKRLDRVLEGALATMLEFSTELETSTVLSDLEEVPRTYSSLVRAAIKLQIIVPSRFLVLGDVNQTDNLMHACREFILFLRKRVDDTQNKRLIIKIEDECIEILSDNTLESPKPKRKRKKAICASDAVQETLLKKPKMRKREVVDEEATMMNEEQGLKATISRLDYPTAGHEERRISDQALLQRHLQDTEEENRLLRALPQANGIGRSGVTMGLLRIKNGHTAESALHGLWEVREETRLCEQLCSRAVALRRCRSDVELSALVAR